MRRSICVCCAMRWVPSQNSLPCTLADALVRQPICFTDFEDIAAKHKVKISKIAFRDWLDSQAIIFCASRIAALLEICQSDDCALYFPQIIRKIRDGTQNAVVSASGTHRYISSPYGAVMQKLVVVRPFDLNVHCKAACCPLLNGQTSEAIGERR